MSIVVAVQGLRCTLVFSILFMLEIKQSLLLATSRSRTSDRFHVSHEKGTVNTAAQIENKTQLNTFLHCQMNGYYIKTCLLFTS